MSFADENMANAVKEDGSFNKEEWIEMKKKEREAAFSTIEDMLVACGKDPATFRKYLAVQGRFPVSVKNALLITAQKPDATRLDDFETWKNRKISISKGERGMVLLETIKLGETEDGKERRGYRTKKLFDVSQTSQPGQEVIHYDETLLLKGLMKGLPCKVVVREGYSGEAFFDESQNAVALQYGLSDSELFRQIAACAQLAVNHALGESERPEVDSFRAKCIGYVLSVRYGIEPMDFRDEEAACVFTGITPDKMRSFLADIRYNAYELSKEIDALVKPERVTRREEAR